jgi:endonuclease/exonuclease/phosphatase family metal-dependent hydrolase
VWGDSWDRNQELFEGEDITTFHEFKGKATGKHIDWILFKGGLTPVSRQVVTDSFSDRYPSDHYPVRARFEFLF